MCVVASIIAPTVVRLLVGSFPWIMIEGSGLVLDRMSKVLFCVGVAISG